MFKRHKLFLIGSLLLTVAFAINAQASELTIPNTFTAGTPARAAEVNENFTATAASVNDLETRVVALEAENTELATENADLTARLESLESFVGQLQQSLSLETDNQGNPSVVFSGVNVHINNGEGQTDSVNGLGNLVVGYDEVTESADERCSDAPYDNEMACVNNGGIWQVSHKSGSHNVVIGPQHNYSQYGGLIAGVGNTVNAFSATVSGGAYNVASGEGSSVSGGGFNVASGPYSGISGGSGNTAGNRYTSVSGGFGNTAVGTHASVSGGSNRTAATAADWAAGSLLEDN